MSDSLRVIGTSTTKFGAGSRRQEQESGCRIQESAVRSASRLEDF
jgi:hypothetical protein